MSNLYARKIKALLWAIDKDKEILYQVLRDNFTVDELWKFNEEISLLSASLVDIIMEKTVEINEK